MRWNKYAANPTDAAAVASIALLKAARSAEPKPSHVVRAPRTTAWARWNIAARLVAVSRDR